MNAGRTTTGLIPVRATESLVATLVLVILTGCGGGDWPRLAEVQRPRASETYAVPDSSLESPVAEPPAPPSPPQDTVPLTEATLDAVRGRLDTALGDLEAARQAYDAALEDFLAVRNDDEALQEAWATAQYRLTRLGAAVSAASAVNAELAELGMGAGPQTAAELTIALAREIARADAALAGQDRLLLIENNRLAVLTPARAGTPGPNAVSAAGRSAFVKINLTDPGADFEQPLSHPIRQALKVAPDLHFHVIASGATWGEAQTNLRRVTATLLTLGVPRGQLVIAAEPDEKAPAQVQIYLRAGSA